MRAHGLALCFAITTCVACGDDHVDTDEDAGTTVDASTDAPPTRGDAAEHEGDAAPPTAVEHDADSHPAPAMPPMKDAGARDDSREPDASDDAGAPDAASGSPDAGGTMPVVAGEIDSVMVDAVYGFGVNGSITIDARPVILFKDGTACFDANFVVRGLDVATHRTMFPKTWLTWMVIDGRVALQNGDKWRVLDFQLKYPPNPSGFTLDKTFSRINAAGGGDSLVVATRDIRLTSDHHIEVGSFAGVTSPAGTVTSTPPDQRGSYAVDGYAVEIQWDSGKSTKTSFYYSDKDPKVVYIGGVAYLSRQ